MQIDTAIGIYTQDKAELISDSQIFDKLATAVIDARQQDFFLLLAMLSDHVEECLPAPKNIEVANEQDYQRSNNQVIAFHQGGIRSAQFCAYLAPAALYFAAEKTHHLGEELYHNLSGHQRRRLADK